MAREKHPEWEGFTPIYDDHNKISHALCNKCEKKLAKRDSVYLSKHRSKCKGPTSTSKTVATSTPKKRLSDSLQELEADITPSKQSCKNDDELNEAIASISSSESCVLEDSEDNAVDAKNIKKSKISSDDERTVLLLNFFLAANLDLEFISNVHCYKLFKAFDTSYVLPSITDFKGTVLNSAYQQMQVENHKYAMRKLIIVQTLECEENVYAISFIVNSENQYIYIKSESINKDDNIKLKLETFCNESVILVKQQYKITVLFLIYDGMTHLASTSVIDDIKYFRLRCFSVLLQLLKYEHGPLTISGCNQFEIYKEYYECLEHLQSFFLNCSLAEATEEMLKKLDHDAFKVNNNVLSIILNFIKTAALGANFFHYKFHGHLFMDLDNLSSLMFDFFEEAFPDNVFDDLASYKNKSGEFKRLFDSGKNYEPTRFWSVAKLQCKSDLCDLAIEMLKIPAIPKKIDMSKAVEIKKKYQDKKVLEILLMSLLLKQ